jgi:hypothetical protein
MRFAAADALLVVPATLVGFVAYLSAVGALLAVPAPVVDIVAHPPALCAFFTVLSPVMVFIATLTTADTFAAIPSMHAL